MCCLTFPFAPWSLSLCCGAIWMGERAPTMPSPQNWSIRVGARTLARYLKRAKALCLKTQQAIREVLIEQKEPRPWEECFQDGLSPPASLMQATSGALPSGQVVAGSFDAPSRLTGPFGFSLSPHGPGKRKSRTETGSVPGVILPHPLWEPKGDFCPFLRPILLLALSHKSCHRHPPGYRHRMAAKSSTRRFPPWTIRTPSPRKPFFATRSSAATWPPTRPGKTPPDPGTPGRQILDAPIRRSGHCQG